MPAINSQTLISWRCFGGMAPTELSKGLTVDFDFTAATGSNGAPIDCNLNIVEDSAQLSIIQGVFIDNVDSGQDFTLTVQLSGQRLKVPSTKTLIFPLFSPPKATFQGTIQAAAAKNVRVIFVNFPVPAFLF